MTARPFLVLALLPFLSGTCTSTGQVDRVGTPAARTALFDLVAAWTAVREARSPAKEAKLSVDVMEDTRRLRDDVVRARTEEELFYALSRVSNARRDGHLQVRAVEGGIRPAVPPGAADSRPRYAAIRFAPDFGAWPDPGFFVTWAEDSLRIPPGSQVRSVHGWPVKEYVARVSPFVPHSTRENLLWRLADLLSVRSSALPPEVQSSDLRLELDDVTVALEYTLSEAPDVSGDPTEAFPGTVARLRRPSFDLLEGDSLLVLRWHTFEGHLEEELGHLMAFAADENLLDYPLILDVTDCAGGDGSIELLRHLTDRAFVGTWATLRVSDVAPENLSPQTRARLASLAAAGGTGGLLGPLPFTARDAAPESLVLIQPAAVHFRGPLAVISGSRGGSQVDQLVAMVSDNGLGPVVGMPTGGFSNSWEWHDTLYWPGTRKPVVAYSWSIGHTLRPDGSVLEGNPAEPDVHLPYTADNHRNYHRLALGLALQALGRQVSPR